MTDLYWQDIVERSAGLDERLGPAFMARPSGDGISERLTAWKKAAADDDEIRFSMRLAALGLTPDTAWKAVSDVALIAPSLLPSWAGLFGDLIKHLHSDTALIPFDESSRVDPTNSWLAPIVAWSRSLLDGRVAGIQHHLAAGAKDGLIAWLFSRLYRLANPSVSLRFKVFQNSRLPGFLTEFDPRAREIAGRAFFEWLDADGRLVLFSEFPGLARLTAVVMEQWLANSIELLERFHQDRPELIATIFGGADPGPVKQIEAGLSDPHHQGRTVARLVFANGRSLMYKPRDMGIDQIWVEIVRRWNLGTPAAPLVACRVLRRPGYGWMEYAPCAPQSERDNLPLPLRCHQAGTLAAILAAFGSTDMIRENVVDGPAGPVLIDLETLLPCPPRPGGKTLVPTLLRDSILASSFPPTFFQADSSAIGIGGMNAFSPDFAGHLDQVESGWEKTIAAFRANPGLLFDSWGTNESIQARCRVIVRDTSLYHRFIETTWCPEALRSGVSRSLVIERLFGLRAEHHLYQPLLIRCASEAQAIENLDIPRFEVEFRGRDLFDTPNGNKPLLAGCFPRSPLNETMASFHRFLNEGGESIDRRLLIESCRYWDMVRAGRNTGNRHQIGEVAGRPRDDDVSCTIPMGKPDSADCGAIDGADQKIRLRSAVLSIGERLLADAIPTREGELTWVSPIPMRNPPASSADSGNSSSRNNDRCFAPMNGFMMSGQAGIGLFLAGLARIDDRFQRPARKTLAWLESFFEDPLMTRDVGIGGAEGLGSIIYALAVGARLLEDPSLTPCIERYSALLTRTFIDRDRTLDVIGGSAGMVLSLYGAERHLFPGDTALHSVLQDTAEYAADHLLRQRREHPAIDRAWKTIGGSAISGFGHGVAGIAAALHLAGKNTGRSDFGSGAVEALSFERALFRPGPGNWLANGSTDSSPSFWHHWCHGAVGIGFSRLVISDDPGSRLEIETAVSAVSQIALPLDHVCCGEAGRLSFLFEAGRQCGRSDWENLAWRGIASMLDRGGKNGQRFRFPDDRGSGFPSPGLFRGIAGLGSLFLRCLSPELFPCPWVWSSL